jgi:Rrf2 family transcriptional regulator, nitric oxide-sensitive transcriptional repressor
MRLTIYTDYCLRVLTYLALRPGHSSTITEIAEAYGISRSHLTKVVQHLGHLGYIVTTRGKHGGIKLERDPGGIRLGQVVQATEGDMMLVECFRPDNACAITPACAIKGYLGEALTGFIEILDRYTLADAVRGRDGLVALLGVADPGTKARPA